MKKKDLIYLVLAVVILGAAGYLVFTQIMPSGSKTSQASSGTTVDVIGVIKPNLDQQALVIIQDSSQTRDYAVPIDLTTGLGNTAPFGR